MKECPIALKASLDGNNVPPKEWLKEKYWLANKRARYHLQVSFILLVIGLSGMMYGASQLRVQPSEKPSRPPTSQNAFSFLGSGFLIAIGSLVYMEKKHNPWLACRNDFYRELTRRGIPI